jgi:putative ABC transport system permease protein
MIDSILIQEIVSTITQNKLRTFFTAFGVFWGIFMLVIMVGSGRGFKNAVYNGFGEMATNSAFMWPTKTTMSYNGFNKDRWWIINTDDIEFLEKNVPGTKLISPIVYAGGHLGEDREINISYEGKEGIYKIYGVYPEVNEIDPVEVFFGRFINVNDIRENRNVAVIGKRVAEELFDADEVIIGKYLYIQGGYYKIVGVFKSKHSGSMAKGQELLVYQPLTSVQKKYNYGKNISYFGLVAVNDHFASECLDNCEKLLASRHNISPEDKKAFGRNNFDRNFLRIVGLINGVDVLIWIVGMGTLLSGIIGVSNIMLIIINKRIPEIGIKRALGAKRFLIIKQIVLESLFLTSIAGYIGLITGIIVIEVTDYLIQQWGIQSDMFQNPEIDLKSIFLSLLLLMVSGVIAGLIPAKKAIDISPVDAIRSY